MERNCPYIPLSKQPLVLVLCQVRFSPVPKIADYIPAIQDEFRRNGYPIERAGKVRQLSITANGPEAIEQELWEYRNRDESNSILVQRDSVVLQTTSYRRFEEYADLLKLALGTVLAKTENDKLGVIQRIGLRYVNLVQPDKERTYRFYLREGLHGVADKVFKEDTHRLSLQSTGITTEGTMMVRIFQNDQGFDLPPDLVGAAPKHVSRAKSGILVTLIDMDHFLESNLEPNTEWIIEKTYRLHDHIIDTFHNYVITAEAVEAWK